MAVILRCSSIKAAFRLMFSRMDSCAVRAVVNCLRVGFEFCQPGLAQILFGKLGIDLPDAPIDLIHFALERLSFFGGAVFVILPHFKTEDIAQHFLAPAGILLRELIGFALQKEGGIDERLEIKPQGLFDACLCLARCFFGEWFPPVLSAHLEFKQCVFVARQGALDTIGVFFMLEGERHFRSFHIGMQIDHIAALAARFAEQTPCDGIQQG